MVEQEYGKEDTVLSKAVKIELPERNLSSAQREEREHHYKSKMMESTESWLKNIYAFLLDWLGEAEDLMLTTSGSTGTPKNITVKKSTMIFSARQSVEYFHFSAHEKWLLCLPVSFVGGMMMLVRAIQCGAEVWAVESKIDLNSIQGNFDFASMIPMQVEKYLNSKSNLKIDRILIGGAAVPVSLEKELQKDVSTQFFASYGMTETVSHIALRKINGKEASEFYSGLKNILLGTDDRGCLTIYHKNYSENVLITNDLVEFDSTGKFKVNGRIDNIINSGGLKFSPEELETKLAEIINQRFIIIGVPDETSGERPVLLIEGKDLDAGTVSLLKSHMISSFGKIKSPKEVVFVERLEETANGKIDRINSKNAYLKNRRSSL